MVLSTICFGITVGLRPCSKAPQWCCLYMTWDSLFSFSVLTRWLQNFHYERNSKCGECNSISATEILFYILHLKLLLTENWSTTIVIIHSLFESFIEQNYWCESVCVSHCHSLTVSQINSCKLHWFKWCELINVKWSDNHTYQARRQREMSFPFQPRAEQTNENLIYCTLSSWKFLLSENGCCSSHLVS